MQFSKSSFNAVQYAASRPSYPPQLYKYVLNYLNSSPPRSSPDHPSTLLDLGCGPGLSTFEFVPSFDRVIGLDPSKGMVNAARGILDGRYPNLDGKVVKFEVGQGEDLSHIESGSVDLVVAGQAAHWFSFPQVWPEIRRVLKPGGSFAFWGYGECFFPRYEKLTKLIPEYSGGKLGAYWQQPGRSIVEGLLRPVPFPNNTPTNEESESTIQKNGRWATDSFQRTYFARRGTVKSVEDLDLPPAGSTGEKESLEELLIVHKWNLAEFEGYLHTWSSANAYNEQHEGADVVGEFLEKLKAGMQKEFIKYDQRIDVAWRLAVLCGRKE